jgi:integrase
MGKPLTQIAVENLRGSDKRREVPDGRISGLYLVVQPSGAKSWAVRYRFDGRQRKYTIGPHPAVDLATARKRALEALGQLAGSVDPSVERKAARAALKAANEADADRIEKVVALFIARHAKPHNRDWRETERMLVKEVANRWRGRHLSTITRAQIHEMLDTIVDRGAPIRANRVFGRFRAMCRWAIARGIIDRSPCDGMKAPSPETRRDRVLSDDELRLIWAACDAIGWPSRDLVRLLMLTGARRNEVAGIEWRELDLGARTWTLPPARSKNGREHVIPLSAAAIEIVATLPRVEGQRFVFSTTGRTSISGFSNRKLELDKAITDINGGTPIPSWTLHDIRRTVATNLQRLGVRLEVTEAVLNHVSGSRGGIVGVYQRHSWSEEKRAALDAWARRLTEIVNGVEASNVVELATARGP